MFNLEDISIVEFEGTVHLFQGAHCLSCPATAEPTETGFVLVGSPFDYEPGDRDWRLAPIA